MTAPRPRRLSALSGAVAVGVAMIVAAPAPAFAHNYLVDSSPEEGGTLTELPEVFSVTTNEPLLDVSGEAAGFALEVRDSGGGYYVDGCLTVEGATLTTPAALGEAGEYTVGWQVVSTDGHTVNGEFRFSWKPPADFDPATAAGAPPACGTESAVESAAPAESAEPPRDATGVRGSDLLWVLGTVVVVGAVLFGTLLLLTRRRGAQQTRK